MRLRPAPSQTRRAGQWGRIWETTVSCLFLNGRFLAGGSLMPIISCSIFAFQNASWVYETAPNKQPAA